MIVTRFDRLFGPIQQPILRHHVVVILTATLLFVGCASVPTDYPREPSTAFDDHQDTSVGQLFEGVAVQHPGKSGFQIMR